LRTYRGIRDIPESEIEAWRLPVLAARLREGLPLGERAHVLGQIRRLVGG
jgi:hypothetical protein